MARMNEVRHRRRKVELSEILPGHLTIKQAAERLNLSYSQVWRYIAVGHLPYKDTPQGYAIPEEALREFQTFPKGNPDFRTKNNPTIIRSLKKRGRPSRKKAQAEKN